MGRRLAVLATIFGFAQGELFAEDWIATLQTAGRYVAVETRDSLAFFASEWGLEIFSIADPTNPVRLSSTPTPGIANELEIDERYSYVADSGNALLVFDCIDPAAPVKAAEIPLGLLGYPGSRFLDLLRVDTILYAAIRGSDSGVYILNIADPANICLASTFQFSSSPDTPTVPYRFVRLDTLLYVVDYRGLWVANIADPGHPAPVGAHGFISSYVAGPECAAASNGRLFVGDLFLHLFDISDPTDPVYVGFQLPKDSAGKAISVLDILARDTFLIMATYATGIKIATIPPSPADDLEIRSLFDTPGYAWAQAYTDSLLVVADGDKGIEVAKWNGETADSVGYRAQRGFTQTHAILGSYLLAGRSTGGLYVVDISRPAALAILDSILTEYSLHSVNVVGDQLFAMELGPSGAAYHTRLVAFDITDTLNPVLLGTYVSPFDSLGLNYSLGLNFATDGQFTYHSDIIFSVIDIRRPDSMYLAGRVPGYFGGQGAKPVLGDAVAFVDYGFASGQMHPIDISNPSSPDVINPIPTPLGFSNAVLEDTVLFEVDQHGGYRAVSVADPRNIYELSNWGPSSSSVIGGAIQKRGSRIIYTGGHSHVAVLDVSDPAAPSVIHEFDSPGRPLTLESDDSVLYVGDFYGLAVFRADIATNVMTENYAQTPSQFVLGSNYPNPFNSGTVITFSLSAPSSVSLSIYNILGQLVFDYDLGLCQAGRRAFRWDGRDGGGRELSSGLYFYRVSTGNKTLTGKMVLLK